MITCGMDEVGRGALAGPLVGAGVVISDQLSVINLRDSKKLSAKQRGKVFEEIKKSKVVFVVEFISVEEINKYGIGWANKEIFLRLQSKIAADVYVADGNLKINGIKSVIKADNQIPEVMAASIIAKVTRDKYMSEIENNYFWSENKGYGTRKHIEAIKLIGPCPHHRTKFLRFLTF